MNVKRKLSGIITCLALSVNIMAVMPLNVSAEGIYGKLSYELVDENTDGTFDYAKITDCGDTGVTTMTVPGEIEGVPVEEIDDSAFRNCEKLTSVTLPDSVRRIGVRAFQSCYALKEIDLPNGLEEIGSSAFIWCSKLESVNIPGNVGVIKASAFSGCSSLKEVFIQDGVTAIEKNAFSGCTQILKVFIPETVSEIGEEAFANDNNSINMIVTIDNPDCVIDPTAFSAAEGSRVIMFAPIGSAVAAYAEEQSMILNPQVLDGIGKINVKLGYDSIEYVLFYPSQTALYSFSATNYGEKWGSFSANYYGEGTGIIGWGVVSKTYVHDIRRIGYEFEENVPVLLSVSSLLSDCDAVSNRKDYNWAEGDEQVFTIRANMIEAEEKSFKELNSYEGDVTSFIKKRITVDIDEERDYVFRPGEGLGLHITGKNTESSYSVYRTRIIHLVPDTYNIDIMYKISFGDASRLIVPDKDMQVSFRATAPEFSGEMYGVSWEAGNVETENDKVFTLSLSGEGVILGYPWADYAELIENVVIPDKQATAKGGIKLGSEIFKGCTSLEYITLTRLVTEIGSGAFSGCDGIEIRFENPNCIIFDDESTIPQDSVIYGYTDSTAQTYAQKYNRNFVSLGEYVPVTVKGDITGDESINLYDAIEIARYIMNAREFTEEEKEIADYNSDGDVNLYDVIEIARYMMS